MTYTFKGEKESESFVDSHPLKSDVEGSVEYSLWKDSSEKRELV